MTRITLPVALLFLGIAGLAGAEGDDKPVHLLDFERKNDRTTCEHSRHEFLSGDAAVGRGAIRWTVPAESEMARMVTRVDKLDITGFGILRLRYRLKAPFDGVIWVGLFTEKGGIEAPITEPSEKWRTLEIAIPSMWKRMQFDPAKVRWFVVESHRAAAVSIDLDHVELIRTRGGWRGAAGGEGMVYRIQDFESGGGSDGEEDSTCRKEVVPDGDGHILRVTPCGRYPYLSFTIDNVPEDLRPFRRLRFRARVASGSGRGIQISFFSGGGTLDAELPKLSTEWKEIEFLLPEMESDETFNPVSASSLYIHGRGSRKDVLELDDFTLVVSSSGWQYNALERLELGRHAFAPVKRVADFEAADAADRLDVNECEVERVPVKKRRGNGTRFALKVTFPEDADKSEVILRGVPRDLRDYRILRFVARVDRPSDADVQVRLVSRGGTGRFSFGSDKGSLAFDVEGFGRTWKLYELLLPEAHRLGDFEPERITGLKISRSGPLTLYLDSFELVKAGGGCLNSDREEMKRRFGDEADIGEIETKRFRVWSETEISSRKFGKHLEALWQHAQKTLNLPPPVRPVELYIFADKEKWADPLLRKSWTVHQVAAAAGHAHAGSLSTYKQDFDDQPFVHELTHAILQRTVGSGGGAWLQEGVAGYIAAGWKRKPPAAVYREAVRKRHRLPLRDLLVMRRIPEGGKGKPRLMAAAFVEFLLKGPRAKQTKTALGTLVLLDARAPAYLEAVEKTMGANLEKLQREWSAWLDGEDE